MPAKFYTPILFLVFNRPDTTQRVFNEIRKVKPPALYVAADGFRTNKPSEEADCAAARAVLQQIDWPCELHTLYREKNLGCRVAVSSAIDWFFEQVEEGIILEDDCLPEQSFFWFCQELLEKYRYDRRVMHIGGSNFQFGQKHGEASYYFSRIAHVWGWATWRRAWQLYDVQMKLFPQFVKDQKIKTIFADSKVQKDWLKNFTNIYNGANTWDYQWSFANLINDGLCIIPNVNLISNIGFGKSSTHTFDEDHKLANMPTGSIPVITHPRELIPHAAADQYTNTKVFPVPSLVTRVENKLKRIFT